MKVSYHPISTNSRKVLGFKGYITVEELEDVCATLVDSLLQHGSHCDSWTY